MSTQQEQLVYVMPEDVIVDDDILKARPLVNTEDEIKEIEDLAENMKRDSQIEPIVVRADGNGFHLIAGRRRRDAAMLINAAKVGGEEPFKLSAVIKEVSDQDTAFRMALSENLKRKNLTPIQVAKVIGEIRAREKWTGSKGTKKVAQFMQVSPAFVTTHEALLNLDSTTQERVNHGGLSAQAAFELLNVKEEDRADTVRLAEQIQEELEPEKPKKAKKGSSATPANTASTSKPEKKKLKAKHIRTAARVSGKGLGFKPLLRGDIVLFWIKVQNDESLGYANGDIRTFAKTFVMWTEGKIRDETLMKHFKTMTAKASKGTAGKDDKKANKKPKPKK